jgi:hypothetical protein
MEPDPAEIARKYGTGTRVLDWRIGSCARAEGAERSIWFSQGPSGESADVVQKKFDRIPGSEKFAARVGRRQAGTSNHIITPDYAGECRHRGRVEHHAEERFSRRARPRCCPDGVKL